MVIFRYLGKIILPLVFVILLSGCFGEEKPAIRIGINAWPGYEFLFLAREKGFFKKHDVKIELVELTSLGDVRLAFERKQVDGMASTLIEVIETRGRTDQKAQVFLIADYSEGGDVIVGLKPDQSIADLKGKQVGSELASLNIFVLTRALEKAGLSITDIEIVPMDQSVMLDALKKEEVSAVVTYPPTLSDILSLEQSHALFTSREIPGEVVDVLSLDSQILIERQDDVRHLIDAWNDAVRFAKTNPEEAAEIMGRRHNISSAEFLESLEGLRVVSSENQAQMLAKGGSLSNTIAKVIDVMIRNKQIDQKLDPDTLINNSALLSR